MRRRNCSTTRQGCRGGSGFWPTREVFDFIKASVEFVKRSRYHGGVFLDVVVVIIVGSKSLSKSRNGGMVTEKYAYLDLRFSQTRFDEERLMTSFSMTDESVEQIIPWALSSASFQFRAEQTWAWKPQAKTCSKTRFPVRKVRPVRQTHIAKDLACVESW